MKIIKSVTHLGSAKPPMEVIRARSSDPTDNTITWNTLVDKYGTTYQYIATIAAKVTNIPKNVFTSRGRDLEEAVSDLYRKLEGREAIFEYSYRGEEPNPSAPKYKEPTPVNTPSELDLEIDKYNEMLTTSDPNNECTAIWVTYLDALFNLKLKQLDTGSRK